MSNKHQTQLHHTGAHGTHQEHIDATLSHGKLDGLLKMCDVRSAHKQPLKQSRVSQKANVHQAKLTSPPKPHHELHGIYTEEHSITNEQSRRSKLLYA